MESQQFGRWTPWRDCYSIANRASPGVYLLARFEKRVPRTVDPVSRSILYIGESCGRMDSRWYGFHRSAFQQMAGHSAGWTFARCFCESPSSDPPTWLYVAAAAIEMREPHRSAYIRYFERWLLWEYVQKHGELPVCNRK